MWKWLSVLWVLKSLCVLMQWGRGWKKQEGRCKQRVCHIMGLGQELGLLPVYTLSLWCLPSSCTQESCWKAFLNKNPISFLDQYTNQTVANTKFVFLVDTWAHFLKLPGKMSQDRHWKGPTGQCGVVEWEGHASEKGAKLTKTLRCSLLRIIWKSGC